MYELRLNLYRQLYMLRMAEQLIIKYYPENEMKSPMHMSMGQEAIPVGVCAALDAIDPIFVTYRSHAAFLAKTDDPDRFFGELYGKETGTAQGKGGSMHLAAPDRGHMCSSAIVGSCIPVAVGAAFAQKQLNTGRIACTFFGDGALDEGAFWESINLACVMCLPVLFVCEDNSLAVHTPTSARQGYRSITEVVSKFNCSAFESDGGDVEVVYELAVKAIELIRSTNQPAFLRLRCYRYLEHVGINEDFEAGYRSRHEFDEWSKRDALLIQRRRLLASGWTETAIQQEESRIEARLESSVKHAKAAPFPPVEAIYGGVFYEKH